MQIVVCFALGLILLFAGRALCGIMTSTKEVLDLCMVRITTVSIFYITLGLLGTTQEAIRGIGYSFTSTVLSIFANIILRIIYLSFIYPFICIAGNVAHNLRVLYILYPASWSVCLVAAIIIYIVLFNKVKRKFDLEKAENNRLEQTKENQTA